MKLKIKKLMEIVDGRLDEGRLDAKADTALISFDSRQIQEGSLFFALKTDKQDGALYIKNAFAKGATLAIAQSNPDKLPDVILVKNTLRALQDLARYVRGQYKGLVIGVTGSSGKTTSKDLLGQMLAGFGKTFKSEGSFNNHIGVPYNICKMDINASYAIFEMGMDHAGEIKNLTSLIRPNVAVVTNVFPMHIMNFESLEGIAYAKAEIFSGLCDFEGEKLAVINADAPFAKEVLTPEALKYGAAEVLTFGKMGQVKLLDYQINAEGKTVVHIEVGGKVYEHRDSGLGERYAYNATMAVAVADALGLDIARALDAIKDFEPLQGRGKVSLVKIKDGCEITLIDDSYNGQPEAMKYAIQTLVMMPRKGKARKVALLGKMAELGEETEQAHKSVGRLLNDSDIDVVIGVGEEARLILDEITDEKKVKIFKESVEGFFNELVGKILQPDDIVLVKGAHYSSRVFEIADALLNLKGSQMEGVWNKLVLALRDYVQKHGFSDVVLGLSGGMDSAAVAVMAVDALGADRVHCLAMPSQNTSELSLQITRKMAQMHGFDYKEFPIDTLLAKAEEEYTGLLGAPLAKLVLENLQARIRGVTLMTYSNQTGYFVLACGNKSESSVGYCTLYGDTCGGLEPIGDVYKSDLYALAKWRNSVALAFPVEVLERAPTAELSAGQLDVDSLPPYHILDAILKGKNGGISRKKLVREFGEEAVELVFKRYKQMAFKRGQMPPSLML